jgi:subtilisin family serine protease
MLKRTALVAFLLLAVLMAGTIPASAGPEKVSPLLRKYTSPGLSVAYDARVMHQVEGVMGSASDTGIRCLIQGDVTRAQLEALGVQVGTQAGNVYTAVIPQDFILQVSDLPGIVRIEAARMVKPNLDVALNETQIEPKVHGATLPPYPVTGNTGVGVLVGDVDTGFDYKHADFRTDGGLSRFESIWDQSVATVNPPAGFTYGREWLKVTLDNQTSTTTDTNGHGTHTMGIAGGNGRGTGNGQPQYQYIGVAPEATLVGVKTDFSDAGIVDAVDYIFQKAAGLGMNAVANLSLGGQFGPHDGTDPFDVAISNLTGAGKIVVVSAGNERSDQIHARGQIPTAGSPTTLDFQFTLDPYTKLALTQNDLVLFDGYYESTDNYSVTVIGPTGQTLGPVARGVFNSVDSSDGAIQIDNGTATSSTGDYEVFIALFDNNNLRPPKAGVWTIRYTRVTSTNSNIDLWNYYTASHMAGRFTSSFTPDVTIGSPGSALSVVTVAAYTGKATWSSIDGNNYSWSPLPTLGAIASFSSRGPLRDGTQKPDITGPGFGVVSTLSSGVATGGIQPYIVPDGKHWIQAGTSMSAPMVTGLAALVLKKEGAITPAQMKTELSNTARTDLYTGAVPNSDWGYGKMSGKAADMTAPVVTVSAPNGAEVLTAGMSSNITWSATDNFAVTTVDLYYSTDGGATFPNVIATGEANDGTYAWTVPATATTTARVKVVANDAGGNAGEDQSNANFTILLPDVIDPVVTVSAPNGAEVLTAGTSTNIMWIATDNIAVTTVDLYYSTDSGATFPNVIATGEANDSTYAWTVPATATAAARVKVVAHDAAANTGEDQSDADFTILLPDVTPPMVTVLTPNGAENLLVGSSFDVTWTATDSAGVTTVDLSYSVDGGATFPNVIATGEANDGTYSWTVPATATTAARVKVVAHDAAMNSGEDQSDADFTIRLPDTTPPTVTVTAPNGGESIQEGAGTDITWTANDTGLKPGGLTGLAAAIAGIDSVTISYSLNNGSTWTVIATGESNDGTYAWTLPMTPTDSALVRVAAYDTTGNTGSDVSDAVFRIASSTGVGDPIMPAALTLSPARPNPLTGAGTAISFGLTREGSVSLNVFDATGRRVAALAGGSYPEGFHTVVWDGRRADGSRAPAGIYFYRLVTPEGSRSQRLMVLR